jgi:ABC-2 type transport system ATP-binding protein
VAETPAAPPVIEVAGLTKRFNGVRALNGTTLTVRRGETYGLLGPNGSGKTTLIRALVGLIAPDQGSVRVLGHAMPDRKALAQVGYMTQAPALYADLSVEENARFFADIFGVREAARVSEVLQLVQLEQRAHDVVATLSGGMRQRLSLACALVHRPALLLLDEPTVGIDPELRVQFWAYFKRLNSEGVTIVVSSHVMDEAERCDRLGLLRDGRLLAEGTARQLREHARADTLEQAFLTLGGSPD